MSSTSTEVYGPARRAAIRSLAAEPKLMAICRMTRGGILAHPWVQDPDVAAYLETEKYPKRNDAAWRLLAGAQRYLETGREMVRAKYDRDVAAPEFTALSYGERALYEALHCLGAARGPDVMASTSALVATIYDMTGRKYSRRYMTLCWRNLVERGFLPDVTPGVSHEGYDEARSNVYHLLGHAYFTSQDSGVQGKTCEVQAATGPSVQAVADIGRYFDEAVERIRRLKWLLVTSGRPIREEDYFRPSPAPLTLAA
jgi:hypothetical protein